MGGVVVITGWGNIFDYLVAPGSLHHAIQLPVGRLPAWLCLPVVLVAFL